MVARSLRRSYNDFVCVVFEKFMLIKGLGKHWSKYLSSPTDCLPALFSQIPRCFFLEPGLQPVTLVVFPIVAESRGVVFF